MTDLLRAIIAHFDGSGLPELLPGGIHTIRPDRGATYPHLIVGNLAGTLDPTFGQPTLESPRLQLSVYGIGLDAAGLLMESVDAEFNRAAFALPDGSASMFRDVPLQFMDADPTGDGLPVVHWFGLYTLLRTRI